MPSMRFNIFESIDFTYQSYERNAALTNVTSLSGAGRVLATQCDWEPYVKLALSVKFMKPGDDVLPIDKGLKNKWRWAWIEESTDGEPFGSN